MSYAYYRFFPGDYMRDTQHLGWYEDLAYRRLIDLYCLHGKPIRNDLSYIRRALRATEPEQQSAVESILAEFFVLKADGWHQKKCDAELRYRDNESDAGRKAAKARWEKEKGKKELHATAMRSQSDGNANQNQNHITTRTAREDTHALQKQWFKSDEGIAAKALELGITPNRGESFSQLSGRIFQTLKAKA